MISDAKQVELVAYVWNEGEEPKVVALEGTFGWNTLQAKVQDLLDTHEYAKITRNYPLEAGEVSLFYRAFDDEFRGRQIIGAADEQDLLLHYEQRKADCAKAVFTPNDLYMLEPVRTMFEDLDYLLRVHLAQDNLDIYNLDQLDLEKARRIEYRELAYDCPDGRRTWQLGTVWFYPMTTQGYSPKAQWAGVGTRGFYPVMVVNSSGRDGDEYSERFITDAALYGEMIAFIRSHMHEETVTGFVRPDQPIPAMTEFYGATIHDFYDMATGKPKKK